MVLGVVKHVPFNHFKLAKFKMVWHDHYGNSEFLAERKAFAIKMASYMMNGVISVNQRLKDWAEQNLAVSKVVYLSNFPVKSETVKANTKLKGVDGKRIVCLANLRPQKDHLLLLQAFKMVQKEEWTLHLVGKDFEDDYLVFWNVSKKISKQYGVVRSMHVSIACRWVSFVSV